jgi:hypothetical protein
MDVDFGRADAVFRRCGVFLIFQIARRPLPEKKDKRGAAMVVLLMLAMGSGGLAGERYDTYRTLAEAAERGPLRIAEGCVEVIRAQPATGRPAWDEITVGGTQFMISRSSAGYDRTIIHGGVLRAGAAVRIHHYENIIVQIDTLPIQCP